MSHSCYEPFLRGPRNAELEVDAYCPSACPVQSSCGSLAQFTGTFNTTSICIREADCEVLNPGSFVDQSDGGAYCISCNVHSCAQCVAQSTCGACAEGYVLNLAGDHCSWSWYWVWVAVLVILLALFLWVVADFCRAHRRPATNQGAVRAGLKHRSRSKVRDFSKDGNPLYPLTVNMHQDNICGIGMTFFMNWFVLVALVAAWLALLAFIFKPPPLKEGFHDLCLGLKIVNGTEGEQVSLEVEEDMRPRGTKDLLLWTGFSYLGAIVLSAIFFIRQRLEWHNRDQVPVPSLFTVELTGFPDDATDTDEIMKYLQENMEAVCLPTTAVVEMSIAYDFTQHADEVENLLDEHIQWAERRTEAQFGEEEEEKYVSSDEENAEPWPGPFWVQAIAYIMLGCDFDWYCFSLPGNVNTESEPLSPSEADEMLASLPNAGTVFVTLQTETLAAALSCRPFLPIDFRQDFPIRVKQSDSPPKSIRWQNFGQRNLPQKRMIAVAIFAIVIFIWFLLYAPLVWFLEASRYENGNLKFLIETLLGVLIAMGNCLVGFSVIFVTEYVGARHVSRLQRLQLLLIIPCVFLNAVVDLYVVINTSLAQTHPELQNDIYYLSTYGLRVIERDVYALLVPGYVFLPYFMEPIFTIILPYWVAIWRVKCDNRITSRLAEKVFQTGEPDIINPALCDMIVATSTFLITFLLPSHSHAMLFLALVFFAVFLYLQNKVRILRWHEMTYLGTDQLDRTEMYLWALPLALLAASFGVQLTSNQLARHEQFTMYHGQVGVYYGPIFFALHLLCHFFFVRFVLPTVRPDANAPLTIRYHDAFQEQRFVATYRNTNPIEVLKGQADPNLVYYRVGKEYLQPVAHKTYHVLEEDVAFAESLCPWMADVQRI